MTNEYMEKVQQDSERCLNIFLGNLPKTECEKCSYKDMGVDCVRILTMAQETVIKELERRSKGEKRIEEMAEAIFQNCNCGIWYSEAEKIADFVINKQGYRKSSEVAREIFEEIDKLAYRFMNDRHYIFGDMVYDLAELKKKYTESEDTE